MAFSAILNLKWDFIKGTKHINFKIYIVFFNDEKSTPKREKFVCVSSNFHMSDIDEYEEETAEAEFRFPLFEFYARCRKKYQILQLKLAKVSANLEFQLKLGGKWRKRQSSRRSICKI